MISEAYIIDGYVDEPACFGVPPYISPYVRYVAGVLAEHGYKVSYCTIDQLRADPMLFAPISASDIVVMISGITVPGKYLGGKPATLTDIRQIGAMLRHPVSCLGGPVTFGYASGGGEVAVRQAMMGFDHLLEGEIASALDSLLNGGEPSGTLDYNDIDRWSVSGSGIVTQHPSFPHLLCEMETARGCSRSVAGGCSFCTETLYGLPRFRTPEGVACEAEALYRSGILYFRLGRQPDLLTYGAGGGEFPKPRPDMLEKLFSGIRNAAPDLKTLHIDNINPGTIAHHEDAAREALSVIVQGHTPGDVGAFGMESADPAVIAANNLKAYPADVMRAIEIVNEVGGGRKNGMPELLPGLNFVLGLKGETEATYDLNEAFLQEVLKSGLMVRRVNIRQLMPFEGTPAYEENTLGLYATRFRAFKDKVRREFDLPMLHRLFPAGTRLCDVIIEEEGTTSFGRQMGSYPILVGIPQKLTKDTVTDVVVVDHGYRSITALTCPVEINSLPISALKWISGIGKKKAANIASKRPFSSLDEFLAVAGESPVWEYLSF